MPEILAASPSSEPKTAAASTAPSAAQTSTTTAGEDKPLAPSTQLDSIYDEFDRLDGKEPEKKPEAKTKPKETKSSDTDTETEEAETKPASGETKTDESEREPHKAKDLRIAYQGLKDRIKKELEPENVRLKARVAELESKKPEDPKPLLDKISTLEKRNGELESEMKFVNYQKSSEFQEKYQKPYDKAWQKAMADLKELTVMSGPNGETRPATVEDMAALCQMPLSQARKVANEMFGDSADDVMMHRKAIRELSEAHQGALKEAREQAGEREKTKLAESSAQNQALNQAYAQANTELQSKYPRWFAGIEGDTDGNKLLEDGFAYVDQMFSRKAPDGRELSPIELTKVHAQVRNKAAGFDRLALANKRLRTKIAELESKVAEYEGSEPPAKRAGKPATTKPKSYLQEVNDEFDALDRKAA